MSAGGSAGSRSGTCASGCSTTLVCAGSTVAGASSARRASTLPSSFSLVLSTAASVEPLLRAMEPATAAARASSISARVGASPAGVAYTRCAAGAAGGGGGGVVRGRIARGKEWSARSTQRTSVTGTPATKLVARDDGDGPCMRCADANADADADEDAAATVAPEGFRAGVFGACARATKLFMCSSVDAAAVEEAVAVEADD